MLMRPLIFHFLSWLLVLSIPGCAAGAQSKKKPLLKPVNINTANFEELQRVPGIGPKTAQRILDTRKSVGRFRSVDELLAVPGMGQKRLAKMRPYLTVGPEPKDKSAPPAQPPPSTPPGEKPRQATDPPPAGGEKPLGQSKVDS